MNPHNPLADVYTVKEMIAFLNFAKRYVWPDTNLYMSLEDYSIFFKGSSCVTYVAYQNMSHRGITTLNQPHVVNSSHVSKSPPRHLLSSEWSCRVIPSAEPLKQRVVVIINLRAFTLTVDSQGTHVHSCCIFSVINNEWQCKAKARRVTVSIFLSLFSPSFLQLGTSSTPLWMRCTCWRCLMNLSPFTVSSV